MLVKDYLIKIIERGKREDMEELSEIFDKAIYKVKDYDLDWYEKKCMELYKMAYGNVLNEEMAKEIIEKMEPYHTHWTLEQTRQVQVQNGLNNIRDIDFWVVMNSAYNDYHDIFEENIDMYVKYAKNFIMDEDGKEDKVFLYFTTIPK